MNDALAAALKTVLAEIQKADGMMLKGGGMPGSKVEIEVEGKGPMAEGMEECEACANGTCTDPDHMDDSEINEMAAGY